MNATACYFVNAMADENSRIAAGLRRHDPDLVDSLIEKYQHRLLRYLVSLTARRDLAEDFFQETWIRVLERGRQFDGRHEFCTWLFSIARNLVIDFMRRKRPASLDGLSEDDEAPFEIPDTASPSALETAMQHEQKEKISTGMEHIATEYREALVLRFQEGMSLAEITEVTGAPIGTVKSRIYRGLKALEPWVQGARL
jgi:RNA polymerase sigma-70 factor, ECF subfamily